MPASTQERTPASVERAEIGPFVIDREEHGNADAVVIRPDDVQSVLGRLRNQAGYDHCSCVTAQAYPDRYETIYHLKQYDDPTAELSVVVPTPTDRPVSQSGATVYQTADWHEREAYDLVGIEYAEHPDPRRILLPETWQGHPLGLNYDQERSQVVPLAEHANPLEEDQRDGTDTMLINVGPHHPATHGVLHLLVTLDGEQVAAVEPDLGYIHGVKSRCASPERIATRSCPTPTGGTGAVVDC